mmetsp:Transcript_44747/g.52440  ORF Transcript_44747/g.52440 Transcript_44747/m.52440 type:complete len:339 (-) Transcript_44747:183-1199(-)
MVTIVTNHYNALGLSRDASISEVKLAYRKLALKYHPDKFSGTDSEKEHALRIFTSIGAAYETLSDSDSKRLYDEKYYQQNQRYQNQTRRQQLHHSQSFVNRPNANNKDYFPSESYRGDLHRQNTWQLKSNGNLHTRNSDKTKSNSNFHHQNIKSPKSIGDHCRQSNNNPKRNGKFHRQNSKNLQSNENVCRQHTKESEEKSNVDFIGEDGLKETITTTSEIVDGQRITTTKHVVLDFNGTAKVTVTTDTVDLKLAKNRAKTSHQLSRRNSSVGQRMRPSSDNINPEPKLDHRRFSLGEEKQKPQEQRSIFRRFSLGGGESRSSSIRRKSRKKEGELFE